MTTRLRRVLRSSLAATGVLDRAVRRRTFDGVVVLCYHAIRGDNQPDGMMPFEGLHVRRSVFRDHCRLLSRVCNPISLAQLRDARRNGAALPPRPAIVTFDDGYRSVLTHAVPALEEFQVPATIFACTDPIARGEMFWYDAVACARGEPAVETLKIAPYDEWREGLERARCRVAPNAPTAPLSDRELEQLSKHPLVTVGGHTHRHPILAHADVAAQRKEIVENLDAVEQWTGRRPTTFAYPNGRRQHDFTAATETLVSDAGIDLAFATDRGIAPRVDGDLRLPRFVMTSAISGAHLLKHLAWDWQ